MYCRIQVSMLQNFQLVIFIIFGGIHQTAFLAKTCTLGFLTMGKIFHTDFIIPVSFSADLNTAGFLLSTSFHQLIKAIPQSSLNIRCSELWISWYVSFLYLTHTIKDNKTMKFKCDHTFYINSVSVVIIFTSNDNCTTENPLNIKLTTNKILHWIKSFKTNNQIN